MDTEQVRIEKLVHGGQGLATRTDGQRVFVWNALPGELVAARIIKRKRSYVEAIAESILEPSPDRITPKESNYLATSPWQILSLEAENTHKRNIVQELFTHEHVVLPQLNAVHTAGDDYHYRNKMEYSFWGDEDGLHLALHQRGSHAKHIVEGSALALSTVDTAANSILVQLSKLEIRAGDLKTIIVRTNQQGEAVSSLFVKRTSFPRLVLPNAVKGLRVYHSNPKSPASVPTRLLYELGDVTLQDSLRGVPFRYDVDSFFQVNLPIFECALEQIQQYITEDEIVDMYSGVGSIGLSVGAKRVSLIELDLASAAMARQNSDATATTNATVIEASTEQALEYITHDKPVIFDPPRAGLHHKVTEQVRAKLPPKIVYLSCNPATQARDIALLRDVYDIATFEIYNFFPHTPHIETLVVLTRKVAKLK